MDLLGPGLAVVRWIVDQIWDPGARNFRAEFRPTTVSAGRSGDFCPELLVTIYNRGRPQMVERAHLLLSNGREFFLEPNGDFERLPVLVSETRNFVVAYSVDELRLRLADHYGRRRPKQRPTVRQPRGPSVRPGDCGARFGLVPCLRRAKVYGSNPNVGYLPVGIASRTL
jgi:hypothetical protein